MNVVPLFAAGRRPTAGDALPATNDHRPKKQSPAPVSRTQGSFLLRRPVALLSYESRTTFLPEPFRVPQPPALFAGGRGFFSDSDSPREPKPELRSGSSPPRSRTSARGHSAPPR